MIRHSIRSVCVILVLAGLAGCADRDPYRRTDVWHPTGSNSANMAAMVADPHDLIRGRGVTASDSQPAVLAVDRISQGQPRSLIPGSTGGAAAASGGGGGGGSGAAAGSGASGGGSSGSGSSGAGGS